MAEKSRKKIMGKWSRRSFPVLLLSVVALLGMAVWSVRIFDPEKEALSPYSAVAMSNGAVYFGRLGWFPQSHLSNAWVLQRYTDAKGQSQFSAMPITKGVWGSSDIIYLSRKNMISWERLRADSSLVQKLSDPDQESLSGIGQQQAASGQPEDLSGKAR